MMKLMKYELLRRKSLLIGGVVAIVIIEGATLFSLYKGGNWDILAIFLTILLVVGGVLGTFLDAVIRLYSDFKQKHGYMIFMTPQSGYRIVWTKTLFAVVELIAAGLLIAGCLALTGATVDHFHSDMFSQFFDSVPASAFWGFAALVLLQLMAQLAIALLAVTVSRTMMQSNSYNWLIALLMYFALAAVVNLVDGALLLAFGVVGDIMHFSGGTSFLESGLLVKYVAIGVGTYAAWFIGCTLLSGRLVSHSIDL
jgi:hypothetical protein